MNKYIDKKGILHEELLETDPKVQAWYDKNLLKPIKLPKMKIITIGTLWGVKFKLVKLV